MDLKTEVTGLIVVTTDKGGIVRLLPVERGHRKPG